FRGAPCRCGEHCGCTVSLQSPPLLTVLSDFRFLVLCFCFCSFLVNVFVYNYTLMPFLFFFFTSHTIPIIYCKNVNSMHCANVASRWRIL
ncbi:hypothetical protein GBAR_LOCUS13765, partial [Geodia barretti]